MEDDIQYLLSLQTQSVHKRKVYIYDPTILNYLILIRKDSNTFNGEHLTELIQIHASDSVRHHKYGEMIKVVLEMQDKKLIKSHIFKGNRLTLKGRWYMIVHNPTWTLWGIILAVIAIVISVLSLILNK